ncbi:DEKNAAC104832 [Brettanomyces naardenensis]|uniref:DEKNAAC104832 n=1 Tax=Brettanomyces naardenensis TaxID=13370 RepID=A0A448YRX0_BRENA|nr:DEKNAAC104832 [Brettanomyces naardenensis]
MSELPEIGKKTLAELLDGTEEGADAEESKETEMELDEVDPSLCVDCQRMPKELFCKDCEEPFCRVCFQFAHRGGARRKHSVTVLVEEQRPEFEAHEEAAPGEGDEVTEESADSALPNDVDDGSEADVSRRILAGIRRSVKFIPLRLTYEERQLLRLLKAALDVSEYTDRVDIISYKSRARRIVKQLQEMCSVLAGLVVSSDIKLGQRLIEDKSFVDNAEWYKNIFEIGRRYKVMNPEKMRDTYGKMCYMVMDSRLPEIKETMEFDLYKPMKTVYGELSRGNGIALKILSDRQILDATAEVRPEGKSRRLISRMIKQKEAAIEALAFRYSSPEGLTREQIRVVLYSIGDFNAYTNKNRLPILAMLKWLEEFKSEGSSEYSLGIKYGHAGARLTHGHEKQYLYVKQALALWSGVMRDLVELWAYADDDLFDGNRYHIADTGQGLNRIKSCPKVYKKMYSILGEVQQKFEYWVGIPVIHLGDDAVPNALFFLDKYIQIPSILIPIHRTIQEIVKMAKDKYVKQYIESQYSSVDNLQKIILCDYFKHGFDGSGADNYYFAGSCVDATSTSSCEFCNQISKKKYYNFFLLTGFTNFNGEGY